MSSRRLLAYVARSFQPLARPLDVVVGYSGGVDSSVLLHALVELTPVLPIRSLRALHVHHGLTSEADRWAEHCARVAADLGVPCTVERVRVNRAAGLGEEGAARHARLAAFRAHLRDEQVLCVAHHADDQAETLLIQMLRGAGPRGMQGMPSRRAFNGGVMLRPLLNVNRVDIRRAASEWGLEWVDDASNADPRHLRARVRHELMPAIVRLCPDAVARLAAHAALQSEAAAGEQDLAYLDMLASPGARLGTLSRAALGRLAAHRRRALLRAWLRRRGVAVPGRRRLLELERQLLSARSDRSVRIAWPGGEVRAHGDDVYAFREPPPRDDGCWREWDPSDALRMAGGVLSSERVLDGGLRAGGEWRVRTRHGGERCRPSGDRITRKVKELLRVRRLPPWERDLLPLVYRGDTLVAVADLFICAGEEAGPGEPGLRLRWQPICALDEARTLGELERG